jgi:hypothetical protein
MVLGTGTGPNRFSQKVISLLLLFFNNGTGYGTGPESARTTDAVLHVLVRIRLGSPRKKYFLFFPFSLMTVLVTGCGSEPV